MVPLQVCASIIKSDFNLFCVACGIERSEHQCRVDNVAQVSEHLDCFEPHTEDKGSGQTWLCLNCSDGGLGFLTNIFQITAKSFSLSLVFLLVTMLLSQVFCPWLLWERCTSFLSCVSCDLSEKLGGSAGPGAYHH